MNAARKLTARPNDPAADLVVEIDMDIAFLEHVSRVAEAKGERHAARDLRLRAMLYQAKATALLAGTVANLKPTPYRAIDKTEGMAALRFAHRGPE